MDFLNSAKEVFTEKDLETDDNETVSYCRVCKKSDNSVKLFSFYEISGWIKELFETLGGFFVSKNFCLKIKKTYLNINNRSLVMLPTKMKWFVKNALTY